MHTSNSETAKEIFAKNVEKEMLGNLSAAYYNSTSFPPDYAKLMNMNCAKFLGSKSVHNWLSEWNLSRTFSGNVRTRRMNRVDKVDFNVQCDGDQIDAEIAAPAARICPTNGFLEDPNFFRTDEDPAMAASRSTGATTSTLTTTAKPEELNDTQEWLNATSYIYFKGGNIAAGALPNGKIPLAMNSSVGTTTNTQTTDTQTSEMDFYRRASYLEEYGMEKVKELRELEERQRRHRESKASGSRLLSCFCCFKNNPINREADSENSSSSSTLREERTHPSLRSKQSTKETIVTRNSSAGRPPREPITTEAGSLPVKRCVLSRSSVRSSSTRNNNVDDYWSKLETN